MPPPGNHEFEGERLNRPKTLKIVSILALAVISVSCGAIFIRLTQAPALTIGAYRLFWATLLLAPAFLRGPVHELGAITRREWLRLVLAGAVLVLHFGFWISSVSRTSVASAVLLVDTAPFFIGLASWWSPQRSYNRGFWIGLLVAMGGCVIIFQGDWAQSADSLGGNVLAVLGAITFAIYFLVGSGARQKLSLMAYVWPVYGIATVLFAAACLVTQTPLGGFSYSTHLYMFLLGLIPQCIGHTAYNWSLRWLPPGVVALVGLAEPVVASAFAYAILNEGLTPVKFIGGVIVLGGIYIATRRKDLNNK
jgi:drug/metabolite transporter (DMT)-like permease